MILRMRNGDAILMQEVIWYEDGKRRVDMKRKRKREREICIIGILTVYTRPPGLHTSGTE